MFDLWENPPEVDIYRPVDRPVIVRLHQVFSGQVGSHQMSLSPTLARRHGLVIQSLHPGRQLAWVRTSTGDWLALVVVEVGTADGMNHVAMQLWLQRHQFQLPHRDFPTT
ncbi:hypothetical protein BST43_23405 [Mycobacteroides saopaulense]|uniref:Uncharacterized protein n=1 Tax=Mycobacteroides saopaulense TaxID=1578165 RepID=A0A1X0IMG7_9MYCO|nr:hypothetical protein BST43_23405 [Mycobacteroides saopaulense]